MKMIKWYNSTAVIIGSMAWAVVWLALPSITLQTRPIPEVNFTQTSDEIDFTGIPYMTNNDEYTLKVTGFSSVECQTTWCNANPERVGHQVALNAKYGKVKAVRIPTYNKTYQVIGTTDYKTDLDIYFGSDYNGALAQGTQYLQVELIY
jgi:hypothetical protein